MRAQQGFTLFEMILTMAIAAIVIGLAAPSFSTMIQDNRISSQSLDFITALNLARSEAIKRSANVTLCKSNDNASCTEDGGWGQGWIVFLDNDTSNDRDTDASSTESILRVHGPLSGSNTLTGNDNVKNFITYTASGSSNQIGTLSLCDPRKDNDKGRAVRINKTGRAKLSTVAEAKSDGLAARECAQ